ALGAHWTSIMITLPQEEVLVRCVRSALDAVAERHGSIPISNADWFPEIATEIASRVGPLGLNCYARGRSRGIPAKLCAGNEWLFDFVAIVEDQDVSAEDRFMAQAALVGEVEWGAGRADEDFDKLLIVDSLVCSMVLQEWSEAHANIAVARLGHAAERRQAYARLRGMSRPPTFILSGYIIPENRFVQSVT